MVGPAVADELSAFAAAFAPPQQGRYVPTPACVNREGVVSEPPAPRDTLPKLAAGLVGGVFVLAGVVYRKRGKKAKQQLG
jgi:hypothetical protein